MITDPHSHHHHLPNTAPSQGQTITQQQSMTTNAQSHNHRLPNTAPRQGQTTTPCVPALVQPSWLPPSQRPTIVSHHHTDRTPHPPQPAPSQRPSLGPQQYAQPQQKLGQASMHLPPYETIFPRPQSSNPPLLVKPQVYGANGASELVPTLPQLPISHTAPRSRTNSQSYHLVPGPAPPARPESTKPIQRRSSLEVTEDQQRPRTCVPILQQLPGSLASSPVDKVLVESPMLVDIGSRGL